MTKTERIAYDKGYDAGKEAAQDAVQEAMREYESMGYKDGLIEGFLDSQDQVRDLVDTILADNKTFRALDASTDGALDMFASRIKYAMRKLRVSKS